MQCARSARSAEAQDLLVELAPELHPVVVRALVAGAPLETARDLATDLAYRVPTALLRPAADLL